MNCFAPGGTASPGLPSTTPIDSDSRANFTKSSATGVASASGGRESPDAAPVQQTWIFTWGKLPACRRGMKTQWFFGQHDKLEAYPTLRQQTACQPCGSGLSENVCVRHFMAKMTCFRRRFKELSVVLVRLSASRYPATLFQNPQRGEKLLGFWRKTGRFRRDRTAFLAIAIGVEVISCRIRIELSSPELD